MAAPTKIKVSRALLLERLKSAEAEAQDSYLSALDSQGAEIVAFRKAFAEALRALAYQVMHGGSLDDIDNEYRGGVRLGIPNLQKPAAPTKPGAGLSKMIRTLELSTEETILVSSTGDYSRYL